jgi:pyruvate dehydrogenase E1 component alpha subunit
MDDEVLVESYRLMWKIRLHELAVKELYLKGRIWGTTHLYTGQEAVAVGVVAQLRRDDYISSTHRGHGHMLAKGGQLKPMMAEILGKATGYCRGKGGSMHIASLELGNLGANGIVSGGLPIAVGAALSANMRGTEQVCVALFSDGATSEGNTHESMNLASLWKLPVVFVCENNQYAVSTHYATSIAGGGLVGRAAAYGIPGLSVDGNDLEAVHFAAKDAIAHVRAGEGPYFLECNTYRIEGHYVGDPMAYRKRAEVEEWRARDPISRVGQVLTERGILTQQECAEIHAEVEAEVRGAVQYAESSPDPALSSMFDHVYTQG